MELRPPRRQILKAPFFPGTRSLSFNIGPSLARKLDGRLYDRGFNGHFRQWEDSSGRRLRNCYSPDCARSCSGGSLAMDFRRRIKILILRLVLILPFSTSLNNTHRKNRKQYRQC